jgi:hypothetical protein
MWLSHPLKKTHQKICSIAFQSTGRGMTGQAEAKQKEGEPAF